MARRSGSFDSSGIISLLVLVLAALVGFGLPALHSGPTPPDPGTAWTPPSPTVPTANKARKMAATPLPPVDVIDAQAGAILAWQEPVPATPSSVPIPLPTATLAAPLPTAAAAVGSSAKHPPNRAELGLLDWTSPSATNTPAPTTTPTATSAAPNQPAPPSRNPSERMPGAAPSPTASRPARLQPTRAVPLPTHAPVPAAPAIAAPPALITPPTESRLAGVVQFVWQPTSALPDGAFYEVVVWSPEQDPNQAWGVAPPVLNQSLWINLEDLFRSGRFREGNLYWTVLVVSQEPYQRLTLPADGEQRYLVYATDG